MVGQRRDCFLIQFKDGSLNYVLAFSVPNPIFRCEKQTKLITCQYQIHEHENGFRLVSEVCSCSCSSLSPHQYICLKNVPTVEHKVFAAKKLIYHPKVVR